MPDGPGIPDGEADLGDRTQGRELRGSWSTSWRHGSTLQCVRRKRYLAHPIPTVREKVTTNVNSLCNSKKKTKSRLRTGSAGATPVSAGRDPRLAACALRPFAVPHLSIRETRWRRLWYSARVWTIFSRRSRGGAAAGGAPCATGSDASVLRSGPTRYGPVRVPHSTVLCPYSSSAHVPTCRAH